jgi:hypothetical protein
MAKRKSATPASPIFTVTANGYRDQLDRARRLLERLESSGPKADIAFQDDVWAFFQNCWNLADWIQNELRFSDTIKAEIRAAVEKAHCLKLCYDIANGTKHYKLTSPKLGARHLRTTIEIVPGEETLMDCVIELPDGTNLSAKKLARECMTQWEQILKQHHLPIERIN